MVCWSLRSGVFVMDGSGIHYQCNDDSCTIGICTRLMRQTITIYKDTVPIPYMCTVTE